MHAPYSIPSFLTSYILPLHFNLPLLNFHFSFPSIISQVKTWVQRLQHTRPVALMTHGTITMVQCIEKKPSTISHSNLILLALFIFHLIFYINFLLLLLYPLEKKKITPCSVYSKKKVNTLYFFHFVSLFLIFLLKVLFLCINCHIKFSMLMI